jgi:hypothetical protein
MALLLVLRPASFVSLPDPEVFELFRFSRSSLFVLCNSFKGPVGGDVRENIIPLCGASEKFLAGEECGVSGNFWDFEAFDFEVLNGSSSKRFGGEERSHKV